MPTHLFPPLPSELVAFIQSGLSLLVGTRDAQLRPDAMRGVGVVVWPDASNLTIYLPVATSSRAVANLRDNGRLAVTLSLPITHRTVQVKGTVRTLRDAGPKERAVVEAYREQFVTALDDVGLPARLTARLTCWPAMAAELAIDEAFEQTPGPDAGVRLGAR